VPRAPHDPEQVPVSSRNMYKFFLDNKVRCDQHSRSACVVENELGCDLEMGVSAFRKL